MKASLMSREDLEKKARPIVNSLLDHSSIDALRVLTAAFELVLERSPKTNSELNKPVKGVGPNLCRHQQHISKIDKDSEIRDFINTYSEPITQRDLYLLLVKKFGVQRAPSSSGLNRYLKSQHFQILHNIK